MLFINTRPVDRAASLTMALEQRAVEVYPLPLLGCCLEWDHDLARLYQQLAHRYSDCGGQPQCRAVWWHICCKVV